jgi:hypothetical protein
MSEFNSKYIDYSKTKFNKLTITEDVYENNYEYTCTYDLDIKFTGVNTDNKQFNRVCERQAFHSADRLVKTHQGARPECLKNVVFEEDEKEGTVDYAIRDWLDDMTRDAQKFDAIIGIENINLPKKIFEDAYYSGKYELSSDGRKLKSVEFDYRKPEVSKVTVIYDDGTSYMVETKNPVTNKDADGVIPGMSLPEVYSNVDDWLQEDYDGTIEILNEIFGFDFRTLKGASIL